MTARARARDTAAAPREVVVVRDASLLAKAVAERLVISLADAQAARGYASVVLTGGGIGTASLRAVRESPILDTVDWSRVDVWWGDERFVPSDDPERNDRQAREALLDHLRLDPARVFAVAASDGPSGGDAAAAAERYAEQLAERAAHDRDVPGFDVLMLGIGPEGHVASIFPESPAAHAEDQSVVPVYDCPKPPSTRVSLTFPSINSADQVWVIAAGEEKAPAVALALADAGPLQVPAAGAGGRSRTLWLLDRPAAAKLPSAS